MARPIDPMAPSLQPFEARDEPSADLAIVPLPVTPRPSAA
jgi:hypothetical protein